MKKRVKKTSRASPRQKKKGFKISLRAQPGTYTHDGFVLDEPNSEREVSFIVTERAFNNAGVTAAFNIISCATKDP